MTENSIPTASSSQSGKAHYMVQLDALRAIAVFAVLFHHYLHKHVAIASNLHLGSLGVRLFFVLSGFLITQVLLRCKELIDSEEQSLKLTIYRFYIRRFLRLSPIYYLTILLTTIVAFKIIQPSLLWHLTYTSNIYFSFNEWDTVTAHFWSLSVEEQFYLFWPWVILFTPKRHLLKVMLLTTLVGPIFRLICLMMGWSDSSLGYCFTFACLDSLGIGSILAFYTHYDYQHEKEILCTLAYWVGIPLFVALNVTSLPLMNNSVMSVMLYTVSSIVFFWLVDRAAKGFSGIVGKFLELKLLTYLGKISYGIYMFHLLVPMAVYKVFLRLGLPFPSSIWLQFALYTGLTLAMAVISWNLIEKPINHLKKRFEYAGS